MIFNTLVDVNVFEDVIRRRKGWTGSKKIIDLCGKGAINGWISSLTQVIIYFHAIRSIGENSARQLVDAITGSFSEIPLRQGINGSALKNSMPEYEDNIQYESAMQFHLDAIITRNKKHFRQENISVYTPEEFIELLECGEVLVKNTSVPFMNLRAQHHRIYNEIDDKLTDVIANTGFILGKYVEEFERGFAEAQGAKYCVGLSSGTDALHVALLAMGIGPGDGVVVPVNTFIATAEAVSLCGATPVFVDCDEYYNMDVDRLKELLEGGGGTEHIEIKAIIPVHLYGQPANMAAIGELAKRYGLKVVEDCCQAHLARYRGVPVGNAGAFGAFSFYPGKNLGAYGEAGALITNDEELYLKAKMIRQHGEIQRYQHQEIGHNYRMEAFQGAVLGTKLKYLPAWTEKRRANACLYNELLKDVEGVSTPAEIDDVYSVYHLYVIQAERRDELQKYLGEKGVATGLHYPVPLHLQRAYGFLGYRDGAFPVAEVSARRILSLPMYPELSEGQIRYVVDKIKDFFKK